MKRERSSQTRWIWTGVLLLFLTGVVVVNLMYSQAKLELWSAVFHTALAKVAGETSPVEPMSATLTKRGTFSPSTTSAATKAWLEKVKTAFSGLPQIELIDVSIFGTTTVCRVKDLRFRKTYSVVMIRTGDGIANDGRVFLVEE